MMQHLLGDLREEFLLLSRERGTNAARLWYARQILLSMPAMMTMIRPVDGLRALAIIAPMVLLDQLWRLVYSTIPLKDGLDRAPGFLAANIVCACLCALASRSSAPSAVGATAVALALAVSSEPPLYIVLALASVTATSHLSNRLRRLP